MDDLILIPVPPGPGEVRRYEVFDGMEPKGFVFQWMTQLDLAKETSRTSSYGKRRLFWSFIGKDGRPNYQIKLETRKSAIRFLGTKRD